MVFILFSTTVAFFHPLEIYVCLERKSSFEKVQKLQNVTKSNGFLLLFALRLLQYLYKYT